MSKIHIHKNKKGQFWVQYIARNGKILAHSETFKTIASARKNITSMWHLFSSDVETIDFSKLKPIEK